MPYCQKCMVLLWTWPNLEKFVSNAPFTDRQTMHNTRTAGWQTKNTCLSLPTVGSGG